MIEVHTYPDGSQRVGCPPFPKLSPKEQAAGKKEPEPEVMDIEVPEAEKPAKRLGRPPKAKTE